MLAKVNSFILLGIDAQLCEVEVDASQHGMEKTVVVGLAQAAVKESLEPKTGEAPFFGRGGNRVLPGPVTATVRLFCAI